MLREQDCPRENRILPIFSSINSSELPTSELINNWTNGKMDTPEIQSFLNWKKQENQIVTYNGYAYCDILIPKTYDFLIDLEDPNGGIETESTIKYALYNGVIPLSAIEHGHKTVCILEFSKEIPSRLNSLDSFESYSAKFRFGLCVDADKHLIIERLKEASKT